MLGSAWQRNQQKAVSSEISAVVLHFPKSNAPFVPKMTRRQRETVCSEGSGGDGLPTSREPTAGSGGEASAPPYPPPHLTLSCSSVKGCREGNGDFSFRFGSETIYMFPKARSLADHCLHHFFPWSFFFLYWPQMQ